MREEILAYLESMRAEEFFNDEDQEWQFRDGSACGVCTASAMLVAKRFCGTVFGYNCANNRVAEIGFPVTHGHDFALIQDRWLVDYWAWRVEALIPEPTFDLTQNVNQEIVRRLYGDPLSWSIVETFTPHGQK